MALPFWRSVWTTASSPPKMTSTSTPSGWGWILMQTATCCGSRGRACWRPCRIPGALARPRTGSSSISTSRPARARGTTRLMMRSALKFANTRSGAWWRGSGPPRCRDRQQWPPAAGCRSGSRTGASAAQRVPRRPLRASRAAPPQERPRPRPPRPPRPRRPRGRASRSTTQGISDRRRRRRSSGCAPRQRSLGHRASASPTSAPAGRHYWHGPRRASPAGRSGRPATGCATRFGAA
mmetsp:Transcript_123447/g.356938  ORF Transcript_123447/g.356938 Transcript_123447/m.356938 type:complete len:237 (+) Transcript_123447:352-1062(+)